MFYLAAAVSDFYIPASEMPEHKIQSSNGPLQVRVGGEMVLLVCLLFTTSVRRSVKGSMRCEYEGGSLLTGEYCHGNIRC